MVFCCSRNLGTFSDPRAHPVTPTKLQQFEAVGMNVHGLVNIAQFFRSTAAVASGRTADSLALDTQAVLTDVRCGDADDLSPLATPTSKHPSPCEDGQVSQGQSRKNTHIHVDWIGPWILGVIGWLQIFSRFGFAVSVSRRSLNREPVSCSVYRPNHSLAFGFELCQEQAAHIGVKIDGPLVAISNGSSARKQRTSPLHFWYGHRILQIDFVFPSVLASEQVINTSPASFVHEASASNSCSTRHDNSKLG